LRTAFSARAILAATFAAFLIYAYPGFISWDGVDHLVESRIGVYTDGHPPAVPALWRIVEFFAAGTIGMLLVQVTLFLYGVYRTMADSMSPRGAAIATALILGFPPVGSIIAVVLKDALMACFIVAAIPLLLDDRRRRAMLGLVVITIGTAMRHNALIATFPLVFLLFRWRPHIGGVRRYAIAIAAWLVTAGAAVGFNTVLADRHTHAWYASHALQDIAGTLSYADPISDDELRRTLYGTPLVVEHDIHAAIRAIYSPVDYRHLRRGPKRIWDTPETENERTAVARAWRDVVTSHPAAYFRYRRDTMEMVLRLDHAEYVNVIVRFSSFTHPDNLWIDHQAAPSGIQDVLHHVSIEISKGWLFYPYIYLAIAILLLPLTRRDRVAFALLASGLLYELAWLFLAPTADYRYSHWMVTTTMMAAVRLFAARYRSAQVSSVP
jgi:hypothetical protein